MSRKTDPRRQQLARIHAGKKQLRLDDDTYRALLARVTETVPGACDGLRSSADMTTQQRNDVLREFSRLGLRNDAKTNNKRRWPGQPEAALMKARPMLRKVGALLTNSKKPWSYAHGLAKKMHQVDKVEWLNDHQLHSLVSALQIDSNRRQTPVKTTTRKTPPC